jgi:GntR family transcriptional repressor for pyruvate dehydrogenase complex
MIEKHNKSYGVVFAPIRLERVADKVVSQLKKAISDGLLRVGDRLPSERDLAEFMGVSRPSIREAVQRLELLGMVETTQGGGSVVRSLTEDQIEKPIEMVLGDDKQRVLELTEIRAFMEAWAAKQAAANRTDEELELMRGCLDEMERDFEKGATRFEVDLKFHTEIAAATHNVIYLHFINSIYSLINYSVRIHREQVLTGKEDQKRILDHHRKIFQAIRDRDPGAAEAAMKGHLLFVVREYKKRLLSLAT